MAENLRFDPTIAPIDLVGDEPPIEPERLNADWIQDRFIHPPAIWTPESFDILPIIPGLKKWSHAAVLIPIVNRPEGLSLLLTKRTEHLSNHAGQISFPGGRIEEEDISHVEAALREMEEEVGQGRSNIKVIGTLPEYSTGTGYIITPVVSILYPPLSLHSDPFEVAEVFEVPLSFLMNGKHYYRRTAEVPSSGSRRTFYTIQYKDRFIWGATAGILRNLFHFLRA